MGIKELLERSLEEVTSLRRANELLHAKVEVFELCASMVQAEPPRRGYGAAHPDIAHELQQRLAAIATGMTDGGELPEMRMAWQQVKPDADKTADIVADGVRRDLANALRSAAVKRPAQRKK